MRKRYKKPFAEKIVFDYTEVMATSGGDEEVTDPEGPEIPIDEDEDYDEGLDIYADGWILDDE